MSLGIDWRIDWRIEYQGLFLRLAAVSNVFLDNYSVYCSHRINIHMREKEDCFEESKKRNQMKELWDNKEGLLIRSK